MSEFFPPDFGEQMGKAFNQLRGVMEDAIVERYEYALVQWNDVNPLARQGWLMVPVTVPGYYFLMSRKLGAADMAADILRQQPEATP
jgi:hypothetical protein